ncbi:DNA cytosine methyltransferase [Polaribacter aquimarinus]|uniref:DNA (cytosine-5-)-methyltransferase n=1 Tax=Polaribacter aquimarinus TaxID=2100726 RepID=A0A2U2JF17_9FLAO|nr:DNA cytosine methyltransferase [Polaribacter aquimarinus]PWG06926.1 DNA cytosine methyltransferase [Polaribacter aquimarinus]
MNKLTVIDFFCGAGGFSEGFRQQGYKIVAGYDHWKPAIDSFNHNYGTSSKVTNILDFKESIEKIDKLPNTDVIIGSPPCVSFSSSNISGKADKESGVLLTKVFLRIVAVKKFQPNSTLKAWYMENVANSRNYLADYYTFNDLGLGEWAKKHRLSPKKKAIILKDNQPLINSADYGSYQARKRAISGEIIKLQKLVIPKPTNSKENSSNLPKWRSLGELLKKMPSPTEQNLKKRITDPIYNEIKLTVSKLTDHFYDSGLYKSEWKQSEYLKTNHPYMGKMSFPENLNNPSRTVTATKSGTSREALIYKSEYSRLGNGEYRNPTIREIASVMGFPYTYQFLGSENSKWRLVGNAVCPSVSRAFARNLISLLEIPQIDGLFLEKKPNLNDVPNLNTFSEKVFNNQPKRNKNSRFRRQPLKEGNLTVTLSNYDIVKNNQPKNKWFTSIQYGTGEGFPTQNIRNNFYKEIEPIILKFKEGKQFLNIINNGFTDKIGSSTELQKYYELQVSDSKISIPTELVEEVSAILNQLSFEQSEFEQSGTNVFKYKKRIPVKQLFALYAINKISSIANKKS